MHPCGSWDRSSMNALLLCSLQDYKMNLRHWLKGHAVK